jgi:three-Cys-motif partner protein
LSYPCNNLFSDVSEDTQRRLRWSLRRYKRNRMTKIRLDKIGYWSEVKLEIVKEYASAYSTIMSKQQFIKSYYYIDGFAGAGVHLSKSTQEPVLGSAMNALLIVPPFTGYHFIDTDGDKTKVLEKLSSGKRGVNIYTEDCNKVLLDKIFPAVKYENYTRALCLLDPYGLDLNWEVMYAAGQSKAIEIFLNFPLMDMNRNILWKYLDGVDEKQIKRMNTFWGDDSWHKISYRPEADLFDDTHYVKISTHKRLIKAFCERLKTVGGFAYVPEPIPMTNTKGGILYYLFFASPNKTGHKIVKDIFDKYRNKGIE